MPPHAGHDPTPSDEAPETAPAGTTGRGTATVGAPAPAPGAGGTAGPHRPLTAARFAARAGLPERRHAARDDAGGDSAPAVAGVAFDFDGTLVLSEADSLLCWTALLAARGVPDAEALARQTIGRRAHDVFREQAHLFPGERPDALLAELIAHGDGLPDPAPVPGAAEAVAALAAAGTPLALVTSRTRASALTALAALGLAGYFTTVVTADDVAAGKPAPDGYALAARRLGLAPGALLGVEDAPAGVAAAAAAGLRVLGLTTTQDAARLRAAGAEATLPDLRRALPAPS